ncbi:hypothetical protein [Planktosalinus lacus]|uniref:YhhN-like protein n=1 Tax=Planktosalinus lacus TaxID=1526573 RepID=A0A8J2V985_9FLAO|nr:hypothetical protein [Planktosalinus lacus]GGD91719.1 hypothetical protein GCM10011312_14390 [Planktosalinus lacus]
MMLNNYFTNKYTQLIILTLILIAVNMYVIAFLDMSQSRMMRVLSVFLFFIFFIFYKNYWKGFVFLALILFMLRDLFIINYEIPAYKTSSFLFTISAYISLIYFSIKKLKISGFTPAILIFAISLIGLNIFNLYYLSEILNEGLDNGFQLILFYLQGGTLLVLGFAAYLYYDRYFGKTPLHYLYFVIAFIFSDLCGLAAYFYKIEAAFFLERFFYLIALSLLVNFALTTSSSKNEGRLRIEKESYI